MEKTKYDFGYILEKGTTNEWAYKQIEPNSVVLELGTAIGMLTCNLRENKGCTVDIVEIDEISGNMAKKFARNACIGKDGNLNVDTWYKKYKDVRYDYIVGLDVFEHLDDPENVFKKLKELLKPEGKIITSIPNLANNAVLINLFNDKFEYTELGLLDRTHRFFFTYETIQDMFNRLEIHIDSIDAIYKKIGMSEVVCDTQGVPERLLDYYNERKLGNVYQFLIVGSLNDTTETINHLKRQSESDNALILLDGLYDNRHSKKYKGKKITFELAIEGGKYNTASFFPMEHSCVVKKFCTELCIDGKWKSGAVRWISGEKIEDDFFIFLDKNTRIECELYNAEKIKISCEVDKIYNDDIRLLSDLAGASKKNMDVFNSHLVEMNRMGTQLLETKAALEKIEGKTHLMKPSCSFLYNGLIENALRVEYDNSKIDVVVPIIQDANIKTVRFFPSDNNCFVMELKIEAVKSDLIEPIKPLWTGGIKIDDSTYVLTNEEKSIEMPAEGYDNIHVTCVCIDIDKCTEHLLYKILDRSKEKRTWKNLW